MRYAPVLRSAGILSCRNGPPQLREWRLRSPDIATFRAPGPLPADTRSDPAPPLSNARQVRISYLGWPQRGNVARGGGAILTDAKWRLEAQALDTLLPGGLLLRDAGGVS